MIQLYQQEGWTYLWTGPDYYDNLSSNEIKVVYWVSPFTRGELPILSSQCTGTEEWRSQYCQSEGLTHHHQNILSQDFAIIPSYQEVINIHNNPSGLESHVCWRSQDDNYLLDILSFQSPL